MHLKESGKSPLHISSGTEVTRISETGKILRGKYCLLQEIGRGGEGIVYLARDTELGKRWCIKKTKKISGLRMLCLLEHDHLPQVVDYWEEEDHAVLVMEYIAGRNLKERLAGKSVTRKQGILWTRQLLHVVSYLHQQSPPLIHGDLKPENLMVSGEGQLYLIDFGSIRVLEEELKREQKGTRGFAAPERQEGRLLIQSDIYGIGKTLEFLWKHIPGKRYRLNRILQKCMKRKPQDRYANCRKLEQDLEKCFSDMEEKERNPFYLFLVLAGLLVMLFTGISLNAGINGEKQVQKPAYEEAAQGVEEKKEERWEALHQAAADFFQAETSTQSDMYYENIMELGQEWILGNEKKEKSYTLLLLAQMCEKRGEMDLAELLYRQCIRDIPQSSEVVALYGLMLFRQGKGEQSWKLYQEKKEMLAGGTSHNMQIWKEKIKQWREETDEEQEE